MKDIFVDALLEHAKNDERVVLVTGDLGFGPLLRFQAEFPDRFINAGVAEQNMIGLSVGLALSGKVVFAYSIANFATLRCLEQIRNDACYHQANVNIVAIGGGFSYGLFGISHHATEDLSIMRALPNCRVFVPGDDWEAREATRECVNFPGTCYLRLDKSVSGAAPGGAGEFVPGHPRVISEGKDLLIFGSGGILAEALAAVDELSNDWGLSTQVVSVHSLEPLDLTSFRQSIAEARLVLSLEEHTLRGGLGSAIGEYLLDHELKFQKFLRLGLKGGFSSVVGSQSYLRKIYGLDREAIITAVIEALKLGGKR